MMTFDTLQTFGRDGMEAASRSLGAVSHGTQTAAAETAEFAKRSLEQGSRFAESLMGAKTVEAAVQVQGEYLRSSYEGLVAQASRMGQLAAGVARDAAAPLEGLFSKAAPSA